MKIKKTLSIFLAAILISANIFCVSVFAEKAAENRYEKNLECVYLASQFRENYSTRSAQSTEINYPDNFGGIYIDENDELHICYTDQIETLTQDFYPDTENISFDIVDYSYNLLENIVMKLTDQMVELSIKEVYIDEFTNQVVVSVETSMRDSIIEYLNNEIDNFEDTTISFTNPINIVQTDASGKGIKANRTLTLG